jgi:hypothetical protein
VRPLLQRARADGAEWSVAFHRVARPRLSRDRIRSWVWRQTCLGLAMGPVSNTSARRRRRCVALLRRPFALARCDAVTPSPLTSLQRIEATDALPILWRFFSEWPRTGSLSEVLHRPCKRYVEVRHGEVRQPI